MSMENSDSTPDFVAEMMRLQKAVQGLMPVECTPDSENPRGKDKFDRVIRIGGAIFAAVDPSPETGDPLTTFFRDATSAVKGMGEHTGNFLGAAYLVLADYQEIVHAIAAEDAAQYPNQEL